MAKIVNLQAIILISYLLFLSASSVAVAVLVFFFNVFSKFFVSTETIFKNVTRKCSKKAHALISIFIHSF